MHNILQDFKATNTRIEQLQRELQEAKEAYTALKNERCRRVVITIPKLQECVSVKSQLTFNTEESSVRASPIEHISIPSKTRPTQVMTSLLVAWEFLVLIFSLTLIASLVFFRMTRRLKQQSAAGNTVLCLDAHATSPSATWDTVSTLTRDPLEIRRPSKSWNTLTLTIKASPAARRHSIAGTLPVVGVSMEQRFETQQEPESAIYIRRSRVRGKRAGKKRRRGKHLDVAAENS
ncbi:hypothetical protein BKA62DRAFT_724637 [Auriculariales sp. MPI-PUGE-AT-0066]|nr:hypothetical protein BKA62DRAFT_724637 [Auriculariales sp. MPI-PUGE-AT-0066]